MTAMLLQAITLLFAVAAAATAFQLVYPFLTNLLSRLWGRERTAPLSETVSTYDFGCVITAYKNARIAGPLVHSLLIQKHQHLHIYLVADECASVDVDIEDPRLTILRPDPPLRLKAKSIMYAMDRFVRPHDFTAVFDADNLAHPDFLAVINHYANAGHRCIQGRRTAKNLDSTYAALDSLGEHYKNYTERLAPYLLGGSAVISGSGMATETALYRAYLDSPEIQQGKEMWKKMLQEDKILQNFLLRRNEKIAYAWDAVCYDEKVDSGDAVQTQRSRWLFSYFQNIPNALGILRRGLVNLSANQFFFGITTLLLPMFLQLAAAFFLALLGLIIAPVWTVVLVLAVAVFGLNVLWTLRLSDAPKSVWDAVWATPLFIWRQLLGLFKMRNPNKNFKHTEHRKFVTVDELIQQQESKP
ncbi:MAG: glycosyltransferase [Saprospiraceae bacterium]|nr:glycosyltransferase [Saprospiraceae bacterium]